MGEVAYEIDGWLFDEYLLAQRHCAHKQLDATLIAKAVLAGGENFISGTKGQIVFTQCGRYYMTYKEAEADAYGEVIHRAVLQEGQEIVDKKIVDSSPGLCYDIEVGLEIVINFGSNFEAAKDCQAAINKRESGPRARLISFTPREEVQL